MPKVSILLPTYGEALTLRRAIESVRAQTYLDWELIVIDDGLAASSRLVAIHYREIDSRVVLVANDSNLGIQRSLNHGLRAASGDYIARIDDDDIWTDVQKLAKQVDFLDRNPDYVLVGTNATIIDDEGEKLGVYAMPERDALIRSRMLSRNCFLHPTIMARADAIQKADGYSEHEEVKHIEDYALWLALGSIGKIANLRDDTTQLTVHAKSLTARNRITQAKRMRAVITAFKDAYPHFLFSYVLLTVRLLGFFVISVVPIPKRFLYRIQRLYKKI